MTGRVLGTVLALAVLAFGAPLPAQEGNRLPAGALVPLGTSFTFQGRLGDGASPAEGLFDLAFSLHDAAEGGAQIGATQTKAGVQVTVGLFTVTLDFGAAPFGGQALWLEIAAGPAGGSLLALVPRQPLTATPFAAYSRAGVATDVQCILCTDTSDLANGAVTTEKLAPSGVAAGTYGSATQSASVTVDLTGRVTAATVATIAGVPPGGTAGGDLAGTFPSPSVVRLRGRPIATTAPSSIGEVLRWSGSAWEPSRYAGVVVVAASGGDFTSIQAALEVVKGTAEAPMLVWVAPGVYSEQVTMEPWVDIEGAGENATVITSGGGAGQSHCTVLGSSNAELRLLRVRNTGGASYATAIRSAASSPSLTHVTAEASGATLLAVGVRNDDASPAMTHLTATARDGEVAIGVYNTNGSAPSMTHVQARAEAATENEGVWNSGSSPVMLDVEALASGGAHASGVYNNNLSAPTMLGVRAEAIGGTNESRGVFNNAAAPIMAGVRASASGGVVNSGVHNQGSTMEMSDVVAWAVGGEKANGVYNSSSSAVTMTRVTATASGGSFYSFGLHNHSASATVVASTMKATGGVGSLYGVYNEGTGARTVSLTNCQVYGALRTVRTVLAYTTRVGGSLLDGGPTEGTVTCAGVWDEAFVFYPNACP